MPFLPPSVSVCRLPRRFVALGAIAVCLYSLPLHAQGFGMVKMNARLQRWRPPAVYLMGTAIDVRVETPSAFAAPFADALGTLLANQLCSNDPRLRVDRNRPETVVAVSVTDLQARERWIHRKSTEYKKVGEKRVWNEKKQKYETQDTYDNVEVTKNYKKLDGLIALSYRATDTGSGAVLHSDAVQATYQKEFLDGEGAPVTGQLPQMLIDSAVEQILPALVPTAETLEVQLAKGKLENASKLGQSGLWSRMLETLETMPPFAKPQDEAYRFYDMAVASEALAYQAEDPVASRRLLEQAAVNYGKAIDLKPDEKYFREPQIRIQTALAQQGKTDTQKALYARSLQARKGGAIPAGSRSVSGGDVRTFTNQNVVELVRSGLDENLLADMIRQAPAVQFDLSPSATLQLLQNKVPNKVIAAMHDRDSGAKK